MLTINRFFLNFASSGGYSINLTLVQCRLDIIVFLILHSVLSRCWCTNDAVFFLSMKPYGNILLSVMISQWFLASCRESNQDPVFMVQPYRRTPAIIEPPWTRAGVASCQKPPQWFSGNRQDGSTARLVSGNWGEVYRMAHYFYFRSKSFFVWRIKSYMVINMVIK